MLYSYNMHAFFLYDMTIDSYSYNLPKDFYYSNIAKLAIASCTVTLY